MNHEELVAAVKSVTDKMTIVDKIIKDQRLGINTVMAFQCSHSGMYFPADYVKGWGTKYGIGLGRDVVSECLNSCYHLPLPDTKRVRSLEQIMYPFEYSFAQVDLMLVPEKEFKAGALVLEHEDPLMAKRSAILRENQMSHKGSMLPLIAGEFERMRNK